MPGLRHQVDVLTPARVRAWPPSFLPIIAGLFGTLWLGSTLSSLFASLKFSAFDLAFFEQLAWNAAHGQGLGAPGFYTGGFLGLHLSPLLLLVAQVQRVWPSAEALNWIYVLALGAIAPSAFVLLRALMDERPGGDWVAAGLAATVPFWPVVQEAAKVGFHTEALGIPLVLLAGWAGLRGRSLLCVLLAVAALTAREDLAYAVLCVGILLWAYGPNRRDGVAIALLSVTWALVAELLVMPALRGGVPTQVDYYDWLRHAGGRQIELAVLRPEAWSAFAVLVLCCAGLPLLRLDWALLALPPLAADMLSSHAPQPALQLQYGLALVVPMLIASGAGARQLGSVLHPKREPNARASEARRFHKEISKRKEALRGFSVRLVSLVSRSPVGPGMAILLALPAIVAGLLLGPMAAVAFDPAPVPASPLRELRACTAQLPSDAPVAADDSAAAALAARPELRLITAARPADWVVVDRGGRVPLYTDHGIRDWVVNHLAGQGRRPLCGGGRFELWSPAR